MSTATARHLRKFIKTGHRHDLGRLVLAMEDGERLALGDADRLTLLGHLGAILRNPACSEADKADVSTVIAALE